jgi:hypothetical protein
VVGIFHILEEDDSRIDPMLYRVNLNRWLNTKIVNISKTVFAFRRRASRYMAMIDKFKEN